MKVLRTTGVSLVLTVSCLGGVLGAAPASASVPASAVAPASSPDPGLLVDCVLSQVNTTLGGGPPNAGCQLPALLQALGL
ncbi:MAG: hypothetical protein ACTHMS_09600 [Jatrophihabitans sp.]|uniref:hypothetical protein n=1 Tax=Jatrophihabitans sp. TaxID=1932789 RepID=UPI003F803C5D